MSGKSFDRVVVWAAVFVLGIAVGGLAVWQLKPADQQTLAGMSLPTGMQLEAMGAAPGETFGIATGPIDENSEGFYVLDYLTGELQCWVPDYRTGRFYGAFKTNITADLPVDRTKDPSYLMITGAIQQRGGAGQNRVADSIVYVLDENTGNFASYTFQWNRNAAAQQQAQAGAMIKVDTGTSRNVAIEQ